MNIVLNYLHIEPHRYQG